MLDAPRAPWFRFTARGARPPRAAPPAMRLPLSRVLPFACLALAALAAFAAAPATAAPHPALSLAPIPDWVAAPLDPLHEVPHDEEQSEDLDYLVSERQVRTAPKAAFVQLAYRVMAPAGLASAAEFSVTFDPAYETVAFHHLRLIRDGRAEDRLALSDFEILREERDRDRALYDGRLTALLHLRDVRVGDIVHFAYTLSGANPVFGSRYVDALRLGWGKPLRQFRYRILSPGPAPAPLHHRVLGRSDLAPETRTLADGARETVWQRSPVPAILGDPDAPEWHFSYPLLQLGDFTSWADVVAWALPLYTTADDDPALRPRLDALRAAAPDPAGRVLAALAFVQDEIRYLGMELGASSHRPSPPALTLERRFGDCKDKTLLLCALLRALDIEADPALVHSGHGRALASPHVAVAVAAAGLHASLPTPLAFNHVIARVRLPDGKVFWLDPTRTHQTGPLAERTSSHFGQALVVRAGETGLAEISRPPRAAGRAREKITFTSHAFDRPVEMAVETAYDGDRATGMRAYLAGRTAAQVTRDYLNYYLAKFPGLAGRDPVRWTDDREGNRLLVSETYEVPDFWTRKGEGWRGELYPHAIGELVRAPASQTRRAPLALSHPMDTLVEIRIDLHEEWDASPLDLKVEDAFSRYVSSTRSEGRVIRASYHYQTKEDHVPAAEVGAHAASLAKIREDLVLTLTHRGLGAGDTGEEAADAEAGFRVNPGTTALATLVVCALAWFSWRVLRRPPAGADAPPPLPAPPLGGWLILFALGVIARAILLPISIVTDIENYFDRDIWQNLTAAGSKVRNVPLALFMHVELVCNLALVALAWLAAILFFQRRREAPRWNIVLLAGAALFLTADVIVAGKLAVEVKPEDWKEPGRAIIAALIWVPYLLCSERVKRTFVR